MIGLGRIVSAGVRALVAGLVIVLVFLQVSDDAPNPPLSAAAAGDPPVATATRIGGDARRTRFIADLTQPLGFSVYVMPDPFRVIIDLPQVEFDLPAGIGKQGRGLIEEYRYGRFAPGKSRIVLDADAPVLIEKSYVVKAENGQPARLVVDLIRTDRVTFAKIRERVARAMRTADAGKPEPPEKPDTRQAVAEAPAESPATPPERAVERDTAEPTADTEEVASPAPLPLPRPAVSEVAEAAPEEPDPEPTTAAVSDEDDASPEAAAEELNQAVASALATPPPLPPAKPHRAIPDKRVVIIDPGHGGVDPGAIGRQGTYEKKVVLDFAGTLRDKLAATGRYKVLMTRDDDTFLRLNDRVRFARRNHADLFISIHADSLRTGKARGATVYTVSERASDREAAELAAKENRSDLIAGVDLVEESEDVTGILLDLAHRETKNHSVFFAKTLIEKIGEATRMHSRPHRHAGFRVLRAPDVPSVLVELGYLSSPADEKLLVSAQWRDKVSQSMVHAVDAFFGVKVASRQ